eukprot:TRINITY_DN367_c0_g2_i1.p1 TRINITY_DN367_c0_g2~~TRINITY_DN367_c0_g2_i1.p1  ORF type:complete len:404 (-),score=81.55 TRINITY_DN367_c0_g2_i1:980-2191(-)
MEFGSGMVGVRQKSKRLAKAYGCFTAFVHGVGSAYGADETKDGMHDCIAKGMKAILTRARRRGKVRNLLTWLPDKDLDSFTKQQIDPLKQFIGDPNKFATAQQKAGLSCIEAHTFAKALLPQGRGWRPHISTVVNARKTKDEEMQQLMPVWGTPGKDGHYVSLKRLLQLIIPWYCAQDFKWDKMRSDAGQPWDIYGKQCEPGENPLLDAHGRPYVEFAVSFDGRSHGKGSSYLSCSVSSKVRGFEKQWQSREWVFLVCEVFGHDSASNMERNCLDFWAEVQALEDGETIAAQVGDAIAEFRVFWAATADMKAHWALFRAGGAGGNATSGRPCHRCDVTKAEMDDVFTTQVLCSTDTTESIAKSCGAFANELRMVNNLKSSDEKAHAALQPQSKNEAANFRPRV